jgi:hypothetical protein
MSWRGLRRGIRRFAPWQCQAEQSRYHHATGHATLPAQSPFDCTGMRFYGLGLVLQLLRLLLQGFEPLAEVVHAVHALILRWLR